MTENSDTSKTWVYSAMTQHGANTLAATMQNKFGCKILSHPKKIKEGVWTFKFGNPLITKKSP